MSYGFWCRALYERAMSVFEWSLPDDWLGAQFDLMRFVLARNGFGLVAMEKEFGYFFQPCTLSGYGFFYQPVQAILSNPMLRKTYDIGKDCVLLRMTPDYIGIWDIIDYFATKLAQLDTSINTALVNSKNAWMLFGKNKSAALALKKATDLINQGEPAVVFDSRALMKFDAIDSDKEPIVKIDLCAKENAEIVGIQLQDAQTILTMFDTEVGIQTVGGNQSKRERLTQFESESRLYEAKARCTIWLQELQDSLKTMSSLFPDLNISVELREEEVEEDDVGVDNNADD